MINLKTPDNSKLLRSAGIAGGAVLIVLGLKMIFPDFDWTSTQASVLTAISAWIINTIRESLK